MSLPRFNFPPESYSAVYSSDVTSANVVHCTASGCEPRGVHNQLGAPAFEPSTPPTSLFSCFHCAFRNGINVLRKEKHAAKNKVNFIQLDLV
ncbi:unnamed protein product [Parnassius apollo]|uniref:(apollo) hypothetical protein n=1 Tax=Parnassius apollo TaxID=110799 RepID=A0A8S3WXU5_PARAO|nr:unnamed protein product [Parnassius apollo]